MNARRGTLIVGAALLGAAFAAGCGDDDEKQEPAGSAPDKPAALTIEATGSGESIKLSAPKTAQAGLTTITLKNSSDAPRSLQLVRVDEGHEPQEGLAAGDAWGSDGKALPAWAHPEGGVPSTAPGQSGTSTQLLPPGKYAAVDLDADEPPPTTFFEVTGETSGPSVPEQTARIQAKEYAFTTSGLTEGRQRVRIDNEGAEPHFVAAVPLKEGKTVADVREFFRTEKGEPPIDEENAVNTPVIEGGAAQVVDLEFQSGDYVLLCFVPDRKGGPVHAAKGMISAATVR